MTRVTMTQTTNGSRDGINIETFQAGQSYAIPDNLARNFGIMGVIAKEPAAIENKAIAKAPETKPEVAEDPRAAADAIAANVTAAMTAPAKGRRRGA